MKLGFQNYAVARQFQNICIKFKYKLNISQRHDIEQNYKILVKVAWRVSQHNQHSYHRHIYSVVKQNNDRLEGSGGRQFGRCLKIHHENREILSLQPVTGARPTEAI